MRLSPEEIEHDPDCIEIGLSFQCEKAKIVAIIL